MNNKFFHIANRNNIDNKPIRAIIINDEIEFKVNENGWINKDDGILLCTRCKYEIEKKELKIKGRKRCPKCKVNLQWNLQSQSDFQDLVTSSIELLNKFFIDKKIIDISLEKLELAFDFINDNDKEELIKASFRLMCRFMLVTNERLRRLENNNEDEEKFKSYEAIGKVKRRTKIKRAKKIREENEAIYREAQEIPRYLPEVEDEFIEEGPGEEESLPF